MASNPVNEFHNQQMREARQRVRFRMEYNAGCGARRANPDYKGLPDNSLGSKNRPFFANKDEAHVPLAHKIASQGGGMHGGVLKNFAYAQRILAQRARDIQAQQALVEGIPFVPPAGPQEGLAQEELDLFDLNQRLTNTLEALNDGAIPPETATAFREVPRLLVSAAATMTTTDFAKLQDIVDSINEVLQQTPNIDGPVAGVARIGNRMEQFITEFVPQGNAAPEEKRKMARTLGARIFGSLGPSLARASLDPALVEQQNAILDALGRLSGPAIDALYAALWSRGTKRTAAGKRDSIREAVQRLRSAEKLSQVAAAVQEASLDGDDL
jgi:hypothetical protein